MLQRGANGQRCMQDSKTPNLRAKSAIYGCLVVLIFSVKKWHAKFWTLLKMYSWNVPPPLFSETHHCVLAWFSCNRLARSHWDTSSMLADKRLLNSLASKGRQNHRRTSSINFGGQNIFARKYMNEKLTKCTNFTWYLLEKRGRQVHPSRPRGDTDQLQIYNAAYNGERNTIIQHTRFHEIIIHMHLLFLKQITSSIWAYIQ